MKLKNIKLKIIVSSLIIFSVVFFILGVIFGRLLFLKVITVSSNNSLQSSVIKFNIPEVPLPKNWSSQENLPGNSFSTALPLNPGISTPGTINDNNAIDYYSFTTQNSSQILVDITNAPKSMYWILYDSKYSEVAASYRSGTSQGTSKVSLQNPGTFYIKVWADYHDFGNYPYEIRLSILPYYDM